MWIDANGDQPHTGFQIHWPSWAPETPPEQRAPEDQKGTSLTEDQLCFSGPPFQLKTEPDPRGIIFAPKQHLTGRRGRTRRNADRIGETTESKNNRTITRQNKQDRPWYRDQLIVDNNPARSAKKLCNSDTSAGPDFAKSR